MNFIRNFFSKNETNLDTLKHKFIIFIENEGLKYSDLLITNLDKKETADEIFFHITLMYSNSLFYNESKYIIKLKNYLSQFFNKEFNVIIHESTVWKIDYDKILFLEPKK